MHVGTHNLSIPGGTVVKNPPANAGDSRDMGSIPESGRSPGVRNGNIYLIIPWLLRWQRICLQCRDRGLIPGLGRALGEGNGNPLQYSCLENSMDRGPWWAKNQTQLSN